MLRFLRHCHLYLGVFTAPALIFFAFTGALQTFSLHEAHRGSSYKPAKWAVVLGQIHKKQTPVVPARKLVSPATAQTGAPASAAVAPAPARTHHPLPMKIFFLIVSLALFVSTVTGLVMSYRHIRKRSLINWLLVAGVVIPICLVFV